jgi:ammonium transporter, Amt family
MYPSRTVDSCTSPQVFAVSICHRHTLSLPPLPLYSFILAQGALVYFMQTGFAMLTAGSIRAKNCKNVLLWNLLDSCGAGVAYWATGYAFSYGGDGGGGAKTFVGNTDFFLRNEGIKFEFWFFQFAFASALSSIVAGAIAERCKMTAYLFYSFFLVGFVYPVVAHAFWSTNGFLSLTAEDPLFGSGAIDLAGSGPVHMCGGVTALVAAVILGPRLGRFHDQDGNLLATPYTFPPHSVALQFLGTFSLWFGWYGFNPGSVLAISTTEKGDVAALATINTTLSACAAALSALFTSSFIDERMYVYRSIYDPFVFCCIVSLPVESAIDLHRTFSSVAPIGLVSLPMILPPQ